MIRLSATSRVTTVAIGLLAGTTSIALADGYGRSAPAPAIAYNWTGFYIGGSVGGAWESIDWRYLNPVPATLHSFSPTKDLGVYGGHIGAQIQFGAIVVGVEAGGIGAFDQSEFATKVGVSPTGPCTANIGQACEARMKEVFTIGPRLGVAWDKFLVYGTGGWATGKVDTQLTRFPGGAAIIDQTSHDQDGWFAGGGVEYALTQNLIIGVEYQHIDLGSELHTSTLDGVLPCPAIGTNCRDVSASEDIVRARLSYKFFGTEMRAPAPLK
jgi:outer membrane immunogenic protein